ncbi:PREDICTED: single-pass membrane and coiled-coil domain-containing protein 2 [Condylura cristata]|uniref:single-pass membrane and coiled-coil domain-containing protein 2 n=1 Tax=Condylura cristata TaxID=143302 RepID=UPI000334538B|nr:PREDICTED: single-pass membrane and coiled-coil domain-containing protein 2 [Condylura cristata]
MALMKLPDKMSLQMKTVGKEHQWLEENSDFLQTVGAERRTQKKITNMGHILERSDDEEAIVSGNPQVKLLHDVETEEPDMLEQEAEHDQDTLREQKERETCHLQSEDPQGFASLQFSEENIPKRGQNMFLQLNHWNVHMGKQAKDLGADHRGWLEKINSTIQNISLTENTVKSLLKEVMSLEGQIEKLESHGDLDLDQWTNIEEKIVDIKKQLGGMDSKSVQEEKLITRIEDFCKDMTQKKTKLGVYPTQEGKTDTLNPEEMGMEKMEALLPQSPPQLVQSSPPPIWKRALRIFIMFYVLTFTVLSFYLLFFDATFIFESLLPTILGRGRMWELREFITPFLNLEVEDLLPS